MRKLLSLVTVAAAFGCGAERPKVYSSFRSLSGHLTAVKKYPGDVHTVLDVVIVRYDALGDHRNMCSATSP